MRLANLLMDGRTIKVIDFDDCGFSWFLYDCATTVSFFEESPEVPALIEAWVRGYRRVGTLSAEDEAEIDTFVMLRRLLLVAWIGSHSETELAQSMGVAYTQSTLPLVRALSVPFRRSAPAEIRLPRKRLGLRERVHALGDNLAAIDDDRLAGDVGGFLRGEEQGGMADILDRPELLQRN